MQQCGAITSTTLQLVNCKCVVLCLVRWTPSESAAPRKIHSVTSVVAGGVAGCAGVLVGDVLTAVSGVDVTYCTHQEVLDALSAELEFEVTVARKPAVSTSTASPTPATIPDPISSPVVTRKNKTGKEKGRKWFSSRNGGKSSTTSSPATNVERTTNANVVGVATTTTLEFYNPKFAQKVEGQSPAAANKKPAPESSMGRVLEEDKDF
eukprot:m.536162 g.536162  ORF g.536162 m.536162 type:complete len:208 (+) comp22068_c0_seq2:209-832(+)